MPDNFTITIKGVHKDLTFPVNFEVDWVYFKRFKIVARNGTLTFELHSPKGENSYWNIVGRQPKTEAGKLQMQYMIEELERYLKNRRYGKP